MKITIEHLDVQENEIILRCKSLDDEILSILSMLKTQSQRLCVWQEEGEKELIFLSPGHILYGESVDDRIYLYGTELVYRSAFTLAELCDRYENVGYLRVSKSMIVDLHQIKRLKSCGSGRIEAIMKNDEKIMISRYYAPQIRCVERMVYKNERILEVLSLGFVHEIAYGTLCYGTDFL